MPLPDAKPSTRIYELLKTTDLENITFSQFQGVAEKIFAEQGAEDELRRIVLVNLARLSVAGEWTGLTSAGGGGAFSKLYNPKDVIPTTYTEEAMQMFFPYNSGYNMSNQGTSQYRSYYYMWPFYAQADGKITDLRYRITTAHTGDGTQMSVIIYDSDDNAQPQTKIGTATLDLTVASNDISATITETSTDSMTLTKGGLYWIGTGMEDGTTGFANIRAISNAEVPMLGITDFGTDTLDGFGCYLGNTAPATWSNATDLLGFGNKYVPMLGGVYQ